MTSGKKSKGSGRVREETLGTGRYGSEVHRPG